MAGYRGALRPAEFVRQRDDTCAGRRPAAILGLAQHDAGNVLSRHPPFLVVLERSQFAAIERKGVHYDDCLVSLRLGFRQFAQFDGALPFGVVTRASIDLPSFRARPFAEG